MSERRRSYLVALLRLLCACACACACACTWVSAFSHHTLQAHCTPFTWLQHHARWTCIPLDAALLLLHL